MLKQFRDLGARQVVCKRLAENDNSKQQVYFGGGFEALNIIPFGVVKSEVTTKKPTMKAPIALSWLDDAGRVSSAPGAQLILYPEYPEVRLSGFLRGCSTAPAELMRVVPKADRRFNNGPDGRVLFLGIRPDRTVVAYAAPAESPIARDLEMIHARRPLHTAGVFLDVPLQGAGDSRSVLLERLRAIHAAGWHQSCRLRGDGTRHSYTARNGAGYTLEALFGIVPNSRAEPDFLGWELKAMGSDRVTLMTPEPDVGYYGDHGVEAFVRRYGHPTRDDTLYFTGSHRLDAVCRTTNLQLALRGYDALTGKIIDVDGGIFLLRKTEAAAGWSFSRLVEHWGRKHASAAYVPYEARISEAREYRYLTPALLGEGTSFARFLNALIAGSVIFDPGSKVQNANTPRATVKARSQFRIQRKALNRLYDTFTAEPLK